MFSAMAFMRSGGTEFPILALMHIVPPAHLKCSGKEAAAEYDIGPSSWYLFQNSRPIFVIVPTGRFSTTIESPYLASLYFAGRQSIRLHPIGLVCGLGWKAQSIAYHLNPQAGHSIFVFAISSSSIGLFSSGT